jgi:hypothetical protein
MRSRGLRHLNREYRTHRVRFSKCSWRLLSRVQVDVVGKVLLNQIIRMYELLAMQALKLISNSEIDMRINSQTACRVGRIVYSCGQELPYELQNECIRK